MFAEEPAADGAGDRAGYWYPADLARFVHARWRDHSEHSGAEELSADVETLQRFFSACYQASLLREEERPVTFRAILASPTLFKPEGRPPESLQRLEFSRSFPFDAKQVRRISVATEMERTLIGVQRDEDGALRIWGVINSGSWWLRDVHGGRRAGAPLPPVPVVHVDAPGSVAAYKGNELVAKASAGTTLQLAHRSICLSVAAAAVHTVSRRAHGETRSRCETRARGFRRDVGGAGADAFAADLRADDEARPLAAPDRASRRHDHLRPARECRRAAQPGSFRRHQIPLPGWPAAARVSGSGRRYSESARATTRPRRIRRIDRSDGRSSRARPTTSWWRSTKHSSRPRN